MTCGLSAIPCAAGSRECDIRVYLVRGQSGVLHDHGTGGRRSDCNILMWSWRMAGETSFLRNGSDSRMDVTTRLVKAAPALLLALVGTSLPVQAQMESWMPEIWRQQPYTWHLASSEEKTGANADSLPVNPGQTLTVLDTDGPG